MKINTNAIENYESMSAEEKLKALEAFEFNDDSAELQKLKNALNKASSDVASYKKQLQEKMTEQELKEAQEKEAREQMVNELNALRKEKTIAGYVASYVGMGYDSELAKATAEALEKGDTATVFANQMKHLESVKQATREENLSKQPPLPKGNPPSSKHIEDDYTDKLMKSFGL